MLYAFIIP